MANEVTKIADDVVVSIDYTLPLMVKSLTPPRIPTPEYIQGHHNIIPPGKSPGRHGNRRVQRSSRSLCQAYGEINPEAFTDVERVQFPDGFELIVGRSLRINTTSGQMLTARHSRNRRRDGQARPQSPDGRPRPALQHFCGWYAFCYRR